MFEFLVKGEVKESKKRKVHFYLDLDPHDGQIRLKASIEGSDHDALVLSLIPVGEDLKLKIPCGWTWAEPLKLKHHKETSMIHECWILEKKGEV